MFSALLFYNHRQDLRRVVLHSPFSNVLTVILVTVHVHIRRWTWVLLSPYEALLTLFFQHFDFKNSQCSFDFYYSYSEHSSLTLSTASPDTKTQLLFQRLHPHHSHCIHSPIVPLVSFLYVNFRSFIIGCFF